MAPVSLSQARALAVEATEPLPSVERGLVDAVGGFLAEPVVAVRALPGCDNSAMDGWAVRSADTQGATRDWPARLRCGETLYAGARALRALGPGEAARIFTGGPLPEGADCVVRQEAARADGDAVELFVAATVGEHVRRRGEEIAEGQRLFDAGQRVDAYVAGVLASQGWATVKVRPRPRVAVLTVGDELLPPGAPAEPHQIHDSNQVLLSALCREAGAEVVGVERVRDEDDVIGRALERWLAEVDVLVTSGGASVGERDRVKRVLAERGAETVFDGVALKPGKPVGLVRANAARRTVPVLVLPGNPGAASVAFDQLGRPLLLALQGVEEQRVRRRAVLDAAREKQPALTYLLSARVREDGGRVRAEVRPQGAGQLLQNVGADGWVVLPAGQGRFEAGAEVEVELFAGAALHARGSAR